MQRPRFWRASKWISRRTSRTSSAVAGWGATVLAAVAPLALTGPLTTSRRSASKSLLPLAL
eukprot:8052711-Lingulodinium_polyedra.AAC.1